MLILTKRLHYTSGQLFYVGIYSYISFHQAQFNIINTITKQVSILPLDFILKKDNSSLLKFFLLSLAYYFLNKEFH